VQLRPLGAHLVFWGPSRLKLTSWSPGGTRSTTSTRRTRTCARAWTSAASWTSFPRG